MKITWDPNKAAKNIARHRVTFDDSASVFSLPDYLRFTLYDLAHDSEEDRWITIGLVARGLLLVVYTTRGGTTMNTASLAHESPTLMNGTPTRNILQETYHE